MNAILSLQCEYVCCVYRGIDFGELLDPEQRAKHRSTTYDLIANIVHEGRPGAGQGSYKGHILHKVVLAIISALCWRFSGCTLMSLLHIYYCITF